MLTNLKRNLGLLLTVAMLSAVVALVPTTAGAAASIVPNTGVIALSDPHTAPADTTRLKACPGDSAAAAGFTDTTSTDVDCIKMFGITTGKTATTYDPTGTISRQDMARFIHRMFVPAGVLAAGLTAVPAFTDIASVDTGGTAAINALASHGITTGTTATTFAPDQNVTRAQMATFLARFLAIAKTSAGVAIASTITSGSYNYGDITGVTSEESESIIRGYNLGLHGASCTVSATGQCAGSTAYRPADDMTRAEMASMLVAALNHTNARPAGVSIQSTTSNLAVGTVSVAIAVRNADFSAQANTLVDEFYQMHIDTAGVAAQTPFTAVLGTCSANVTKTAGTTLCSIDANDASTDVRGNIAGTNQTTAAYRTGNWWVHTGASGAAYVDGTTSTVDTFSLTFGAASALVDATSSTVSTPGVYALVTDMSAYGGITAVDSLNTYAGDSRTFTMTLKNAAAPTSTIKPGYSIKVSTTTTDAAGNVAITTAYYPVSGATASWTTTCPADDSALTSTYKTAIEHRISMGALLDADGLPAYVTVSPLDDDATMNWDALSYSMGATHIAATQTPGTIGMACDDAAKAYTEATTHETLSISSNNYAQSTAGSLMSITSTAYDQYGLGIAGVETELSSNSYTNATGGGATLRARLTTGTNGTASLSAVVCAGSAIDKVEWAVVDTDSASTEMDAIATGEAEALTDEGTTVYCTVAATDAAVAAVTAVRHVWTYTIAGGTLTAQDSGALVITVANLGSATLACAAATNCVVATIASTINSITGVTGVTCAATSATVTDCTFAAGTGVIGDGTGVSAVSTMEDADGVNATESADANTAGVDGVTNIFVDDDTTANYVVSNVTTTADTGTAGASVAEQVYTKWLYDSTDVFTLGSDGEIATAVTAASETQFETEAASLTGESGATPMSISYRTGALTTGISAFQLGS